MATKDFGMQVLGKAVLCILVLAAASTLVQGISTSCRTRTVGQAGMLICEFSENINRTRHGFVIFRYDLHVKKSPEEVLQCIWLSTGLECVSEKGYQFDKQVSNVVVLDMPTLTRDMEGRYVCQVTGNNDDDDKSCKFTYTAATQVPDISPAVQQGSVTVNNNQINGTVILLATYLAVFVAFAFGLTFMVWRWLREKRGRDHAFLAEMRMLGGSVDEINKMIKPDPKSGHPGLLLRSLIPSTHTGDSSETDPLVVKVEVE